MPVVTIQYNLPDEQGDFDAARLGRQMAATLWDVDQRCRALLKHGDPSEETASLAEEIRGLIREGCPDAMEI
jgi:hypothetical protein